MSELTRLKKDTAPSRLIFLDSETLPERHPRNASQEIHKFRLAVLISGEWRKQTLTRRREQTTKSPEETVAAIESLCLPRTTTWLIAHNVSFDARVCGIFQAIQEKRWRICDQGGKPLEEGEDGFWSEACGKAIVIGDPPTIIRVELPSGGKLLILDSMNYCTTSLATLGQSIGRPKLSMPEWFDTDETWEQYCANDTRILEEWFCELLRWLKTNNLGPVKTTAAAQAMAAYRFGWLRESISSHQILTVREMERESYFGGEFRVFRLGHFDEPTYQLDVNSLFPSVMRDNLLPAELHRWHFDENWHKWNEAIDPSNMVAEVILHADDDDYPVRTGGEPVHARGFFRTVLCGPDLLRAAKQDHIAAFRRWATYKMKDLFSAYVDDIYRLRRISAEKGRRDQETFAKMLLNSLYGKFGQMGTDLVHRAESPCIMPWGRWIEVDGETGEYEEWYAIAGEPYQRVNRKEIKGSCPVISSWIASLARDRMRTIRNNLPAGTLLYQGVDSLIVTKPGKDCLDELGLIHPTALGLLKLQCEEESCSIFGHGYYRVGDKVVLPGKSRSVPLIDGKYYQSKQFERIRSTLLARPGTDVIMTQRINKIPEDNLRGTLRESGVVEPWYLQDDESEWNCNLFGRF